MLDCVHLDDHRLLQKGALHNFGTLYLVLAVAVFLAMFLFSLLRGGTHLHVCAAANIACICRCCRRRSRWKWLEGTLLMHSTYMKESSVGIDYPSEFLHHGTQYYIGHRVNITNQCVASWSATSMCNYSAIHRTILTLLCLIFRSATPKIKAISHPRSAMQVRMAERHAPRKKRLHTLTRLILLPAHWCGGGVPPCKTP